MHDRVHLNLAKITNAKYSQKFKLRACIIACLKKIPEIVDIRFLSLLLHTVTLSLCVLEFG